ncbi:hypothetical protein K501DRAFT_266283 [Backusella circina FSU 941]|nr:hypothetical protein K501DRAFT_266283 [Backusella circina FSU 941]
MLSLRMLEKDDMNPHAHYIFREDATFNSSYNDRRNQSIKIMGEVEQEDVEQAEVEAEQLEAEVEQEEVGAEVEQAEVEAEADRVIGHNDFRQTVTIDYLTINNLVRSKTNRIPVYVTFITFSDEVIRLDVKRNTANIAISNPFTKKKINE